MLNTTSTPCDHCRGAVGLGVYGTNGQKSSVWTCVRCGCIWLLMGFRLLATGFDCPVRGTATKPLSPVLARLIEEVSNENVQDPHAYDRVYNRHHRS